jgi:hypothetical protein
MKEALLDIEAILSNATAELSLPQPNCDKARKGIDVARKRLLDLTGDLLEGNLLDAKRKLVLIYLGMTEKQFSKPDVEIFSILAKERELQAELERARKNN